MKILLVEDDKIIWENIKKYLEENNFVVDWETDWESGFIKAINNQYHLYILDIMMPIKDGISLAKDIRKANKNEAIIFLTAKDSLESKEEWFMVWADDYIVKPFKLKELLLRTRSVMKRSNQNHFLNKIRINDIELNLDTKTVKRNNKEINLTKKEFQILEYLMRGKNKVITKQELLEFIWWINNDIWSDVVRSHIQTLRSKINKNFSYDPIKTIRWVGFMFQENNE